MQSPFPGMDPYVEDPDLWRDFHPSLATEIRNSLNRDLSPNYYARTEPYVALETIEVARPTRGGYPDVTVGSGSPTSSGGVATLAPVCAPPTLQSRIPTEGQYRLRRVEVRAAGTDELVTVIEILSPVNKRPTSPARDDYLRRRRAVLRSQVHLLEIDLLRGGARPPLESPEPPPSAYRLTLCRGNRRPTAEVWAVGLRDPLPTVPVPVTEPDPDVPLDLSSLVGRVYEQGRYWLSIAYDRPPPPPTLSPEECSWIADRLRSAGATPAPPS